MRRILILALGVALALVAVPAGMNGAYQKKTAARSDAPTETADETPETAPADPAEETVAVFMPETDRTETLLMRDYIIGCVAAEMPAAYESAALTAQAAASVTLARYMQRRNRGNAALKGGVIAADPASYQGYLDEAALRARWGEEYDLYYQKIAAAVDEALPYAIENAEGPVLAAFHAVSSGLTESAETIWGDDLPYLTRVESAGDRLSPGYASEVTVSAEAFREGLSLSPGDAPPAEWLGESAYSPAGTLLRLSVCGKTTDGQALRAAFSLRSPGVRVRWTGEAFQLSVTGYGHGVGMSQYGADYYARQGMTWREILAHYYPGTEVKRYEPSRSLA